MSKKNYSTSTSLVHPSYQAPQGFAAFPTAIHHASTVLFKDVDTMRARSWHNKSAYTYGLHGTPTSFTLEGQLAAIEGGEHCVLAPSGLSAISLVSLTFLNTGDDVLIPDNAYGPNKEFGEWLKSSFGMSVRYYDPMIGAGVGDLIQANTKLLWTEAPGSVSMEVPDLPALCAVAKSKGVVVALDNTWSAGLALKPFELGVDISMQALTKYQSGGSDVLMGAVITRDGELNKRILTTHMRLGLGVGMDDVYLVLRGLQTMKLRFDAHDQAARKVATWLKARPEIAKVLHPAWEDCPGHEFWKRDFSGAGGLFSVIFDPQFSEEQTDRFVNNLELFKIGFSWGGTHSLCVPYRIEKMRQQWNDQGILVRFNIGLEDTEDLIADIEQAMAKMV
ncbi:cystathionine beta-lyase [Undibacterium cyanobacteriorum]|uniref:Cystathionine beta-lyase n=1 Tax=Undibacterium cyanobacteriorum TaxID=3073561 RepID=A0ABY9RCK8_9BURK|nr:cystathionine beta-lyase [Undibacterium sp. 20NA77.5]WMW78962.1 cystathionine beta-lyase [Undibacterium sp. 20NA77.5]